MHSLKLLLASAILALCAAPSHGATYTVTSTASGNTPGTFAHALNLANTTAGPDTIRFAIGSGPVVVNLSTSYLVYDQLTIDGTTQPGYDNKPVVTLKLAGGPAWGLLLFTSGGEGSVLRGVAIAGDFISAPLEVKCNNVSIERCWIGVNRNFGPAGSGPEAITCGYWSGTATQNLSIKNCLVGNYHTGIHLVNVDQARIEDSAIGTDFTGTHSFPLAGMGINVIKSTGSYIGASVGGPGNVIANCGAEGVGLSDGNDTVFIGNRIFNTSRFAIDYGPDGYTTYPDDKDLDIAAGKIQNYPENVTVERRNGVITVEGALNSTPSTEFLVEVYACNRLVRHTYAELKYKVGVFNVTTAATGGANFSKVLTDTLPTGEALFFTALVTRMDQTWGTSEVMPIATVTWSTAYLEKNLDTATGWVPSGIDSGPEYALDPTSTDDVDLEKSGGALKIIVRPSPSLNRIAGWKHPSLMTVNSQSMITAQFVRAKFYIYATNPMDAPLNNVPSFRIRLENESAVLASAQYQYSLTGRTSPAWEPFYASTNNPTTEATVGPSIRPTDNASKPSLYRLDFMVPTSPAAEDTHLGATFESMATEDPANGTLALTEVQLATFFPPEYSTYRIVYAPDSDFSSFTTGAGPGTPITLNTAMFNAENDFQPGRRQSLDLPGEVPASTLPTITPTATDGVLLDTANVPADRLGVGMFTIAPDVSTSAPRVTPGKHYLAMFIASSDMPAIASTPGEKVQGGMNFEMQTGGGAVTHRLEISGPPQIAGPAGSPGRTLLESVLPGKDSTYWYLGYYPFPQGEAGGAYVVFMPSPLSQDIRATTPGNLGPWADQPGDGVAAPSLRTINLGVNVISQPATLRVSPSLVIPWAAPNRARVRLSAAILAEGTDIDDGGYEY